MPRTSTRKRRKSRQYESEEDSGNRAPTKTHPLKQRKKPKVDPSFIVRESDDEPSILIKEQDANIRYFENSGVFSRDIGVQSILCHEVFATHEEEVEEDYRSLLTQENLPETKTTGFEEKVEPPVLTSPFSFLIRAADSHIESEIRGSGRNAILLAGNAAKVSRPMPSPNKSPTTLLSGNATKVSHPMPIAKPLPPTKTPATRKPDTPANTMPLVVTQTPTGIVVGKAPIVVTKTPAKILTRREKRRAEREARVNEARDLAQKAADLAARAIESPVLSKRLLLSMVFVRTNPRSPPATWPPKGSIIPEGFFWTAYPPLETTLETHMRRYYDLSVKKCQSREQQAFNNDMVTFVRVEAAKFGWKFDVKFTDKALRDRVRCYFKTRIQNSKKRLLTMLKDPTKPANTKALIQHLDMIRNHSNAKVAQKIQQGKGTAGTKIQMAESERKEEAARKCKYDFSGPQVTLSQQSEAATALECDLAGPLVTPQSDEALTVANLTANDLAHIASRAIAADVQEDYEKALPLYHEALERLIMALNYEKDEDRKQMILERVDRYVKRAETLLDYLSRQAELKVERGRGASMKSKEEEDVDARKKALGALDSEKSMSKAVVRAQ